jgi:DNA polymerase-3 subunit delta'
MFTDIIGHPRAKEMLARMLAGGTVHAGLLFAGPPGVGKRLAADEFVRAWLCLEGGGAPCGRCDSCAHSGGKAHPDRLEVVPEEKKKSISIDQVRKLIAWIAQTPARGQRKAVIVDPADALGAEAANALLKTLEEPPRGSVIVLVASRPAALPATVLSRCQQVSFGPLTDEQVCEVLRRHLWPAQASLQAAALAEGSPGAALARDGRLWQEAAATVNGLLERLAAGDCGAALAFAEGLGEGRERALAALQALIASARLAGRRRLGDRTVADSSLPASLQRLGADRLCRFLAEALELHRRLEGGDRPPNVKLALATLLAPLAAEGAVR